MDLSQPNPSVLSVSAVDPVFYRRGAEAGEVFEVLEFSHAENLKSKIQISKSKTINHV